VARIRRGGYIFVSWIGDHPPRHVHVFADNGKFVGRVNLESLLSITGEAVDEKILEVIRELKKEGRL
jgi:hypothetical protein